MCYVEEKYRYGLIAWMNMICHASKSLTVFFPALRVSYIYLL